MGNRSRTEIVAMILDAANEGGETKTKIMFWIITANKWRGWTYYIQEFYTLLFYTE